MGDTAGLQKLSIASKIAGELDRHVQGIIASGDIAHRQKQHINNVRKMGKMF